MVDPLYAGLLDKTDVIDWMIVNHKGKVMSRREDQKKYFGGDIHVLIRLQEKEHFVGLQKIDNDDQMVIDRMKFMCNINANYMARVDIPLTIKDGMEREPLETKYLLYHVPFTKVHTSIELKIVENAMKYDFDEQQKIRVCAILLFRFMFSIVETLEDKIRICEDTITSTCEIICSNGKIPSRLVTKYASDDKILNEAKERLLKDFDFDCMRGIIMGSRQPEREFKSSKSNNYMKLSISRTNFVKIVEDRYQIIKAEANDYIRKLMIIGFVSIK